MKKATTSKSIKELIELYNKITFPEYQREPNVWDRKAKQRLIDSVVREFDIASLYFYLNEDLTIDCIDGRQRLNALMSFFGDNINDPDNAFEFSRINDIYDDEENPFTSLEGQRLAEIKARGDRVAVDFVACFENYQVTVVELAGSRRPEEFNLQFTRLNLGVIINSGEKLHAMVGEMRDCCFHSTGIGSHPFLEATKIPTRRFAREQVAAQILCQVFSLETSGDYTRTRHFDLQRFFREHITLSELERDLIGRVRTLLDLLSRSLDDPRSLRNRAITVSLVLLAWQLRVSTTDDAKRLTEFIGQFTQRLSWQVGKGLDVDAEYRYLIDFQRHLTQASVEKPAVASRADVLKTEWIRWIQSGNLRGDREYQARTGVDPRLAPQLSLGAG